MSYVQITQTFTQHNLLTLPREIRDDIYLAVLQSPSEPPQSPEDAGPRFAGFGSDLERGNNVFYPTAVYPRYACQSLQACNHQMNIEVPSLTFATWEVEMRIFDNCHGNQFGSDGGPGPIFRPLFNLLSGLFHHGPQFVYKGSFGRQLHVNAMVITICRDQLLNKELRKDAVAAGSPSGVLSRRHGIRQSVWSLLRMIASRGTLFGRVSKLKLNTDEGSKEFLVPDRNLAQETVDYWDGHGFHWGVKTPSDYDSLR